MHSKTTILVVSLDTYENEEKKVKIHILFCNLHHYTDTIIESMDNFFTPDAKFYNRKLVLL